MKKPHILISIPGLRITDLSQMPQLNAIATSGAAAELSPTFPAVTCTVQASMATGTPPNGHGVIANGFYWPDKKQVEMWTTPAHCIDRPTVWEKLAERGLTSAVWFPLHTKGCSADYVCSPAPIHNPDGSESLWCYTKPESLYGDFLEELGHFPLSRFWGPMTDVTSSRWIIDSAILAAQRWQPDFFYIYIPHLDYAAQRSGPDSPQAMQAVVEADELIGVLTQGFAEAYDVDPTWLIAGEYAITPATHVTYPNRALRDAGLLSVQETDEGELLDIENSKAFAMVDHQFSHVFIKDDTDVQEVASLFESMEGIDEVLVGDDLARYELDHERSGQIVLVSSPESWQAYYWWNDDAQAPPFARKVDIHRKPGYDPVELFIDMPTRSIPLDATLVKGTHGAPARAKNQKTLLVSSDATLLDADAYRDTDVFNLVMKGFG